MSLKKPYLFAFYIFLFIGLLSATVLIDGCKQKSNSSNSTLKLSGDAVADGKLLAQLYCSKCHAQVPVDALPNDVWIYHTLPSMAHYFGLHAYLDGYFKQSADTSGLTLLEYQDIVTYYKKMAPKTLAKATRPVPLNNDWAGFSLKMPPPAIHPAYTTMVAFNPDNHKIYTSDYIYANLAEWNTNLTQLATTSIPTAATGALFEKEPSGTNQAILSCIGRVEPVDFPNGRVVSVNLDSLTEKNNQTLIASDLARPVQTIAGDFDKDGLADLVVLGQGNTTGGVYLLKQNKDHTYTQTTITEQPGAVQAIAGDFNKDGWTDFMVLFGTGDEGLWLFTNDHKGGFTSKNLLRFPPVYGSTSFQLVDLDHDGKPDLIYTCGYNFRDSRVMKPYHGLYIFKNMGNWDFKQQWFFPIDGCTRAIAADFDGNGHIDIATSAFFADMQTQPEESFIYFEQVSPFNFKPHAIPVSKYGRWFCMDVGDYNNDGKLDIILGNYSAGFLIQPDYKPGWNKNMPFIVLQNNFKKLK